MIGDMSRLYSVDENIGDENRISVQKILGRLLGVEG
jgi:hypothetical protein